MNKYCNIKRLLHDYEFINRLVLELEIEDAHVNADTQLESSKLRELQFALKSDLKEQDVFNKNTNYLIHENARLDEQILQANETDIKDLEKQILLFKLEKQKQDLNKSTAFEVNWTENSKFKTWHSTVGYNYNPQTKYEHIMVIRDFIQGWLNDMHESSRTVDKNGQGRKDQVDRIEFFFRGCYKERRRFLLMFGEVTTNLLNRLNMLDGGCDNNIRQQADLKELNKHRVGFGH